MEIRRRVLGPEHPDTLSSLNNLALINTSAGLYRKAGPLYEQVLEIRRRVLGLEHPSTLASLNNLALLYVSTGRYKEAEPLLVEAAQVMARVLGPEHPDTLTSLNNVASLYTSTGRDGDAETLMLHALETMKRVLGPEHPSTLTSSTNLAVLYASTRRYDEAEPLLKQTLEIRRRVLGPEHPDTLRGLSSLGVAYLQMGRYEDAEPLLLEAVEVGRRVWVPEHPDALKIVSNLGGLYAETGRYREAAMLFSEGVEAGWRQWRFNAPTMSAALKRRFFTAAMPQANQALWNLAFQKSVAVEEGLVAALLMKRLFAEAERQDNAALQKAIESASPKWLAAWEKREQLRRRYANLVHQRLLKPDVLPSSGKRQVEPEVAEQLEQLEQQLRRDNSAYAVETRLGEVGLGDVRDALRRGEALVEYVRYNEWDFGEPEWGIWRYGAFVLQGSGKVAAIDLGDAETIDKAIRVWRGLVQRSIERFKLLEPSLAQLQRSESQIGQSSSALRELIWEPLSEVLSEADRVYVSPDGLLSLVAFGALAQPADEGGWRYLAEERELIYLYAGRELGRLALRPQPENLPREAVLVSNPAFDAEPQALAAALQEPSEQLLARTVDEAGTKTLGSSITGADWHGSVPRNWPRVPALDRMTNTMTELLERIGWSVTTLKDTSATEEAVISLRSPRLLQFGTHGHVVDAPTEETEYVNPLLRSTLLLAGVNNWSPESATFYRVEGELLGEDEARATGLSTAEMESVAVELADGILTAYEVTGMDLRSTELVNLTACETGLGTVSADGVASLRQAFLLAGARSLTARMWEVPVTETTIQTADFYERWLGADEPTTRYRAFRDAQLAALDRARQERGSGHPFYWAGTVYVGDPGDLPEIEMTVDTE